MCPCILQDLWAVILKNVEAVGSNLNIIFLYSLLQLLLYSAGFVEALGSNVGRGGSLLKSGMYMYI